MGDPAPLRRRTHGGAGAGALALVKPSLPKAVAGRPGFTRAKRPRLQSPPADRWAAIQDLALAPSLLPGATSPIRNSKEPKKRTLGQFLTELRKRVDIDEHFDMILEEFLDKRNTLIHRVMDVPGWSLDTEEGCLVAYQFVNRLMTVDEAVRDTFTALMVVWQKSEDIKTAVDHLFGDIDTYRKIVNHTFFEKE